LRRRTHNIFNHSKWRRIEKDWPKCSVIGRRLMKGLFTRGSYRVIKSWRILILFERIFWRLYIFAWQNIWVFIILLLPSDTFLMLMARPQCDTPLVWFGVFFFLFASSLCACYGYMYAACKDMPIFCHVCWFIVHISHIYT